MLQSILNTINLTLSKGGNLYLYNLKTSELKTIKDVSENEEIVDVKIE